MEQTCVNVLIHQHTGLPASSLALQYRPSRHTLLSAIRPDRSRARVFSRVDSHRRRRRSSDRDAALHMLLKWLRSHGSSVELDAVGHRLVYGGRDYDKPQLITPRLIEALTKLVEFQIICPTN